MIKLNNSYLFTAYVIVVAVIAGFIHKVIYINNAKMFDSLYLILMIIAISLYSILFNESNFIPQLKNTLLIGLVISMVASVVFYILDKTDYYFTLEMEGYTWIGLYGAIKILLYLIISSVIGIILWKLKLLLKKLMSS